MNEHFSPPALPDETPVRLDSQLGRLYQALEHAISHVPPSRETKAADPQARARAITNRAASRAAMVSGGLALPVGPLGMATVIPDLIAIWKIQAQMVADIAGAFGQTAFLSREQMIYCLFRHAAAQLVRGLVTRAGERFLIRRLSGSAIKSVLKRASVRVTERVVGKAISRWLPIVGAVGVGAYAYYDTAQVGKTAMGLFAQDLQWIEDVPPIL